MFRISPNETPKDSFNGISERPAREFFTPASELPESNFEARTLAQKLACVAVGALVVIGNLGVAL